GKSDRVVRLEGEAFFEIAPDEKRPFRLETGPVTTTALGTAFNATSRDDRVEIHLTEGRVSVKNPMQEVILNPGEMAAVNDRIEVGLFDEGQVTAWKEGRITFQKKSITEILSLLEKWYGVSITDKSSLDKKRTVTGTFNNENLADILNGLSFSVGFVYQIDDKNVQIQ
ncbi:MAG TPA: FecR domain-containing protein, partial [Sphingobacteriaceae bacterium]|nr:FecR domain-containing protein [Sphingobacteriaceae bacterium]